MRQAQILVVATGLAAVAAAALPGRAAGQAAPAELLAHAVLPALTMAAPPPGAPALFGVSGRYAAGAPGRRVDRPLSVEAKAAAEPRRYGVFFPFIGQPVQGFSGIETLARDRFRVITDNGFGNKLNSPDTLLMFHEVRVDWEAHQAFLEKTTFLRDPDGRLPYRITLEGTAERFLTGADLDTESIQTVGELIWIGDEFGPYLIAVDASGKVVFFTETMVDGKLVRSPDHLAVTTPASPGAVAFELPRSRGFEGMAVSPDGRFLYPLLEGSLFLGEPAAQEKAGERNVLRLLEFDTAERRWTGRSWKYPVEAPSHAIGDFNMVDATRALIIERDNNEGDPRRACKGAPAADCFAKPAGFKRIYLIDLEQTEANGTLRKIAYLDLLAIRDPKGVGVAGTIDGVFAFPFQTIENVDLVDARTIVVADDNNLPFSAGRRVDAPDNNEFILLDVGGFLERR